MRSIFERLRHLDAYSKPMEDFRLKTLCGGALTVLSSLAIILLIVAEVSDFFQTQLREEIFVDTSTDSQRVKIHFDVTFPALPCDFLSVDVMDVSGEHQDDVHDNVWKVSLDKQGRVIENTQRKEDLSAAAKVASTASLSVPSTTPACASCYGAETALQKCCPTCDDVKRAYQRRGWVVDVANVDQCKSDKWMLALKEKQDQGCRVYGSIEVSKVAGNFHIAPGRSMVENHIHVHDLHGLQPKQFNTTLKIEHFAFGEPYPGKMFPLDGHLSVDLSGGTMFQFYVKSVPTLFAPLNEEDIVSQQFSVTKHRKPINAMSGDGLPGFFIVYEFAPFFVRLIEWRRPLAHLLTSLCAVVGGVFTVASLIDALLNSMHNKLWAKIQLDKAS